MGKSETWEVEFTIRETYRVTIPDDPAANPVGPELVVKKAREQMEYPSRNIASVKARRIGG